MSLIRVLINGSKGKMGQESVKAVNADPELDLVAGTDLGDDLAESIVQFKVQVVVDFTTAAVALKNAVSIIEAGARPVIGTSGMLPEQVAELKALCTKQKLGGIIAPNFAIGAVLMMKYSQDAAKYFPHVEVIELHHDRKADAPSGTAIKTANLLAESRDSVPEKIAEKEIIPGARGANAEEIRIHSVRLPGLVAHQEVLFGGQSQTLTIRHDSFHRDSFMPGVCLACKKVMDLNELIYGLEHLL
ncbi:MAG: 4-hydroxy-tetrahydrodipicolinate reductase [SAR324 cluster bacterium]|nr:4-hydroxy-tetrahydrodipicolinate reductase [SAR324 cluster bacterium]MBL7034952.1 4-hydroxy-tetrahydrodipicolinate reductase [SAR324 cluster bacterium]